MSTDNFYRFHCKVVGQQRYLAGCYKMLNRIDAGADHGMWPECAKACKQDGCPAVQMREQEMSEFRPIFYIDRDDVGPGVVTRAEQGRDPRTDDERAVHHDLAAGLDVTPYDWSAQPPAQPQPKAAPAKTRAPKTGTADQADAFDLGTMITEEVAALKEGAA